MGLSGGFFNAVGGTAITAYSRAGADLGTVTNTQLGIEFLGLRRRPLDHDHENH